MASKHSIKRNRQHRDWIAEIKRQQGCMFCGQRDPLFLDFHHPKGVEKFRNVADMTTYSLDRILAELQKCDLLCRSCHSTLHHSRTHSVRIS